jgi:hypothetical protein
MVTLRGLPYSPTRSRSAGGPARAARALRCVRGRPSLGEASRRSFTDAEFAVRYADLLGWRDALYEAHRPR